MFQCDTGYMPQEEVTSTCLSNSSWVPAPECKCMYETSRIVCICHAVLIIYIEVLSLSILCKVIDCGNLLHPPGFVSMPVNGTKFGASVTFRCEESMSEITALCHSNGKWVFSPSLFTCGNPAG